MRAAVQWVRSAVFVAQFFTMMAVMGVLFFPLALASRRGAVWACRTFCGWALFTARILVGITTEIRGPVPQDPCLIAAKHQSFLDILMIFHAVPAPRFIMKRELIFAPFLGQYALRLGCIPVDRGRRSQAVAQMVRDVEAGKTVAGQLIIYPQGTRVRPGVVASYKIGAAALYETLGQPCVPAATNAGLFWPRAGLLKTPGHAVVEFLAPIPPGLDKAALLAQLGPAVESASNTLMAEAGFGTDG